MGTVVEFRCEFVAGQLASLWYPCFSGWTSADSDFEWSDRPESWKRSRGSAESCWEPGIAGIAARGRTMVQSRRIHDSESCPTSLRQFRSRNHARAGFGAFRLLHRQENPPRREPALSVQNRIV